jgi:hypothetical protein
VTKSVVGVFVRFVRRHSAILPIHGHLVGASLAQADADLSGLTQLCHGWGAAHSASHVVAAPDRVPPSGPNTARRFGAHLISRSADDLHASFEHTWSPGLVTRLSRLPWRAKLHTQPFPFNDFGNPGCVGGGPPWSPSN